MTQQTKNARNNPALAVMLVIVFIEAQLSVALVAHRVLSGSWIFAKPPTTTGTVSGGAFVNWQRGGSDVLRGQQIVLCKESLKEQLAKDSNGHRCSTSDRHT